MEMTLLVEETGSPTDSLLLVLSKFQVLVLLCLIMLHLIFSVGSQTTFNLKVGHQNLPLMGPVGIVSSASRSILSLGVSGNILI